MKLRKLVASGNTRATTARQLIAKLLEEDYIDVHNQLQQKFGSAQATNNDFYSRTWELQMGRPTFDAFARWLALNLPHARAPAMVFTENAGIGFFLYWQWRHSTHFRLQHSFICVHPTQP